MSWGFLELLLAVACCNNSSDPMRFMGRPRLTKVVLESELTITMVYYQNNCFLLLVYDLKKKQQERVLAIILPSESMNEWMDWIPTKPRNDCNKQQL